MNGKRRKILASLGSLLCRCALSSFRMLNPLVYLISAETGLEQLGQLEISLILDLIIPRPSVVNEDDPWCCTSAVDHADVIIFPRAFLLS